MKANPLFYYAAAVAAIALAACTIPAGVELPRKLEPAPDEMVTLVVHAKGVQIYECRANAEGDDAEWAFIAPEAELFDLRGHLLGRHGAGPSWETLDGSSVRASVKQRADAPVAGAIPWLLLKASPDATPGRLGKVTSILRVNTEGGVAPADGCDASRIGKPARVPYKADYLFLAQR
jgi:hypothetical protein